MKTYLLFLLGLCSSFFVFAQNDCEWEEDRLLIETNTSQSESLPWISSDGLRIYFTGSFGDIERISRPHVDSTFRDIQALSISTPLAFEVSCWLSEDELEIWFKRDLQLMYAQRPNLMSPFSQADSVKFDNLDGATFIGPSMTPDRSQLFLYINKGTPQIVIFESLAANEYVLSDTLAFPSGIFPGPGQLSRDGYKYFFSGNINKIYSLSRDDLSDTFDIATFEELPVEINDPFIENYNPSVTADGNLIAFVRNSNGTFDGNDLAIARREDCDTATEEVFLRTPFQLTVHPNPTPDDLTISWQNLEAAEMQIVNLQGQILQRAKIQKQTENQLTVQVDDYSQGLYFCRLVARSGLSETVKFVVE